MRRLAYDEFASSVPVSAGGSSGVPGGGGDDEGGGGGGGGGGRPVMCNEPPASEASALPARLFRTGVTPVERPPRLVVTGFATRPSTTPGAGIPPTPTAALASPPPLAEAAAAAAAASARRTLFFLRPRLSIRTGIPSGPIRMPSVRGGNVSIARGSIGGPPRPRPMRKRAAAARSAAASRSSVTRPPPSANSCTAMGVSHDGTAPSSANAVRRMERKVTPAAPPPPPRAAACATASAAADAAVAAAAVARASAPVVVGPPWLSPWLATAGAPEGPPTPLAGPAGPPP